MPPRNVLPGVRAGDGAPAGAVRRSAGASLVGSGTSALASRPAAAHGVGHPAGHAPVRPRLAGVLLVAGAPLLIGSRYADHALDIEAAHVDAGVAAGLIAVTVALAVFWL